MSRRPQRLITDLLPGTARVVIQLYDPERRVYSQPPGFSFTVPRVRNSRELHRLLTMFQGVSDAGSFRDDGGALEGAVSG